MDGSTLIMRINERLLWMAAGLTGVQIWRSCLCYRVETMNLVNINFGHHPHLALGLVFMQVQEAALLLLLLMMMIKSLCSEVDLQENESLNLRPSTGAVTRRFRAIVKCWTCVRISGFVAILWALLLGTRWMIIITLNHFSGYYCNVGLLFFTPPDWPEWD